MTDNQRAHARPTDPETSHEAAKAVTPYLATIRDQVEHWADQRGPALPDQGGFIDEELSKAFGDAEHSSYRTRRAELADERVILDSGLRRANSGGRSCVVWVHRRYVTNPPAQRPPRPSKADLADLKRRGRECAAKLLAGAAQMRSEGRRLFAEELEDCATLMGQLAA